MSAVGIIEAAAAEGVTLTLSTGSTLHIKGAKQAVAQWLLIVRDNKPAILNVLKAAQHKSSGLKVARRKPLSDESKATQNLKTWLQRHAGNITVIRNESEAIETIERLKKSGDVIGIDIETAKAAGYVEHPQAGLHPKISRIRLVQLYQSNATGVFVIDCFAAGHEWLKCLSGGRYVAHNAMFECSHFWHHFKEELDIQCTMLADRVFSGENRKLSELVAEHLELNMSKALQTSDWSRPDLLIEQIHYAAADAVAAKLLWQQSVKKFEMNEPKYKDAYQFLNALTYPVIRQVGLKFDDESHAQVVAEWQREEQTTRQVLAELGLKNPASVKQKQVWLRERLSEEDMEGWPLTETGNLSTASDALDQAQHIPGAAPLARWGQVSSRLSNFGLKLASLVIDGHLYPNYRTAGGVTGRFGCSSPNIQNQPRSGFKHLYLAPEGHKFVTGDLSQIELRVAGLISGDPVINNAYANGRDLHREVAAERANKRPEDITKQERQAAKAINFGLIFGAGANTLRQQAVSSYGIDMSMDDAQEAKAFFRSKYQRLTEWQREVVDATNSLGYSESPYIKLTRHYDQRVYTHAMNFPIQSGAWEVLALAIIYIDKHLPIDGSIRISHHVYDELCLVARDDQMTAAAFMLRDGFLHGFQTVFPNGATRGLVEIGAGQTWEDAGLETNRIKEASL